MEQVNKLIRFYVSRRSIHKVRNIANSIGVEVRELGRGIVEIDGQPVGKEFFIIEADDGWLLLQALTSTLDPSDYVVVLQPPVPPVQLGEVPSEGDIVEEEVSPSVPDEPSPEDIEAIETEIRNMFVQMKASIAGKEDTSPAESGALENSLKDKREEVQLNSEHMIDLDEALKMIDESKEETE